MHNLLVILDVYSIIVVNMYAKLRDIGLCIL